MTYSFTGLFRTLGVAGGVLLFLATGADAASWQWSAGSGRERVVIDLDAPKQEKGATRTGPTQLDVTLGNTSSLTQTGAEPALGSLITGFSSDGTVLRLQTRDAAFGYIVSRPNSKRVVIDVFPDPLGTRWRAPGTPAPATAASRAVSALPEVPVIHTPATPTRTAPSDSVPANSGKTDTAPRTVPPRAVPPSAASPRTASPRTPAPAVPTGTVSPPEAVKPTPPSSRAGTSPSPFVPLQRGTSPSPFVPLQRGTSPSPFVPLQRGTNQPPPARERISPDTTEPRAVAENTAPVTTMGRMAESAGKGTRPAEYSAVPEQTVGYGKDGSLELRGSMARPGQKMPSREEVPPVNVVTQQVPSPVTPPANVVRQQAPSPVTPPANVITQQVPSPVTPPSQPSPQPATPGRNAATVATQNAIPGGGQADAPDEGLHSGATPSVWGRVAAPQGKTSTPAPAPAPVPVLTAQTPPVAPSAKDGATANAPAPAPVPTTQPPLVASNAKGGATANAPAPTTSQTPAPKPSAQTGKAARTSPQPATKSGTPAPVTPAPATNQGTPAPTTPAPAANQGTPTPASPSPATSQGTAVAVAPQPSSQPQNAAGKSGSGGVEILSPNALRAPVNPGGPEDVPAGESIGTENYTPASPSEEPAPVEARKALVVPESTEPTPAPEVIYVDEEGKTIPKPPDTPAMLAQARKLIDASQYKPALELLQQIKEQTLNPGQQEDVLYMISEATNGLYTDHWLEGYEPIVVATNEAMNYNLRSSRVPEALMRLGMINLRTGNQGEAAGYFGALQRKYPLDPNVPAGLLALGKDQFDKGQYAESVINCKEILDKYPDSKAVRTASRLMADALFRQGHNKRALVLVDFVDRRWPRMYLEDPDYLRMVGELYYQEGRLEDALHTYLTYYNLIPDNPENDKVLLRLGTIYLKEGLDKGARDIFEELLRKYPTTSSAPIALQRLGEQGMYDGNPSLDELVTLFSRPNTSSPEVYYRRILKEYPKSPEAELSKIRLAAWAFWNKDTQNAMEQAQKFIDDSPNSPATAVADEIIRRGFNREVQLAREEENYDRILTLWDRYPQVQAAHAKPEDDLRVALARAQLNRGNEQQGMDLLSGFLDRPAKDPTYGEYVYNLFLARALHSEDWNGVLGIGDKVAQWDLPVAARNQLDYARAISAENLGAGDKALPLWRKLHTRDDIPLYQKAYATYFMARDAEHRRDLGDAYRLNLDTLNIFTKLEKDHSDKADPERIRESLAALMDVTEVANRYAEALDWAEKYARFVPENSPDYAGLRFRVAGLHRKMGDLGRWRAILNEIIKREPDSVFGRMAASELRTQEVARDLTRFTPDDTK